MSDGGFVRLDFFGDLDSHAQHPYIDLAQNSLIPALWSRRTGNLKANTRQIHRRNFDLTTVKIDELTFYENRTVSCHLPIGYISLSP